jgi:hypothetical protein
MVSAKLLIRNPVPAWANQIGQELRPAPATITGIAERLSPSIIGEKTKLGAALYLRDQVYNCPMQSPPLGFDWAAHASPAGFLTQYTNSVYLRQIGHECGGRAILYLSALQAFGIKGRYVGLWPDVTSVDSAETLVHATTEVFIDGCWIAMDAHYNMSLQRPDGVRIGYQEAQARLHSGQEVIRSYDGFDPKAHPPIEYYIDRYNTTFTDLFNFIMLGIHVGSSAAIPLAASGSWDGVVTYIPGQVPGNASDAKATAEGVVYQSLIS